MQGVGGSRPPSGRRAQAPWNGLPSGYGANQTTGPTEIGAGAVGDVGLVYQFDDYDEGGFQIGAHGRSGLSPDNRRMRAVFLTVGLEARLGDSWYKHRYD